MRHEKTTLPNGLKVVSVPLTGTQSVSIGVWVHAGGRDEAKRFNGIFHFIEHLVFKGTQKRTMREIKESIEGKGGSLNAFTGSELTCFLARVPKKHAYHGLDVLVDMVLSAEFKNDELIKERKVVIEEIKMVQDNPSQHVEEILDEMFWMNHPLGRPLAGTVETVSNITRQDLLDHRDRFYNPAHITVAAAGDIHHKRLVQWCRNAFGSIPTTPKKTPQSFDNRHITARFRMLSKDIEQTHLALAFKGFGRRHPDQAPMKVLNIILGGNMSSRLFNEIREERGLAYEISSGWKAHTDSGSFAIDAGVDACKTALAMRAILDQCRKLKNHLVSSVELDRAKEFHSGQIHMALETTMDAMLWAGEEVVVHGNIQNLVKAQREVRRVTPRDLRRIAREIFNEETLNCAMIGPLSTKHEKEIRKNLTLG